MGIKRNAVSSLYETTSLYEMMQRNSERVEMRTCMHRTWLIIALLLFLAVFIYCGWVTEG